MISWKMKNVKTPRKNRSVEVARLERRAKRLENKNTRLTKKSARLEQEVEKLREEVHLLKLQIKEYQEKFFKKNKGKPDDDEDDPPRRPKKRGAPKGHPGKTRKTPDRVDEHVDVHLDACPHCGGKDLSRCKRHEDHYQEDIVIPQAKVTRFRHHYYYCPHCKKTVHGVGKGEMPGSYIGPVAKSATGWLHYKLGIPYRKVQRVFKELLGFTFVPSSCPGFDGQIRIRGHPIYEKVKDSLPKKGFVHADETGWRKEGENHWLWCFAAPEAVVYKIDRSRGSKVVESVLGKKYGGVLVSDFLKAYNPIRSRKQRCLVHLLRLIKKRQVYFAGDRRRGRYFGELKELIKEVIDLSNRMDKRLPINFVERRADLTARLKRKLGRTLDHARADRFLKTLRENVDELVTCLDFKEVCAHNNWAERLLRGNVIMRKITFGNRSDKGIENHEVIMSLIETAHLKNLDPLSFLRLLLVNPTFAHAAILPDNTSTG
jgi:transposase